MLNSGYGNLPDTIPVGFGQVSHQTIPEKHCRNNRKGQTYFFFSKCHSMNSCISPCVGARCHIFYWNYFLASFTDWNRLENESHCIQQSEGKSTESGKKVHVSCCFLTYMYWENNLKSSITSVYLNQAMHVKSCHVLGEVCLQETWQNWWRGKTLCWTRSIYKHYWWWFLSRSNWLITCITVELRYLEH